jgi:hypothetical protein
MPAPERPGVGTPAIEQEGGHVHIFARCLAPVSLAIVVALGVSAATTPASAQMGDGSVRYVSINIAGIVEGGSAEARLLLPAVRNARFQVAFINDDGQVLAQASPQPPARSATLHFPATFRLTFGNGQMGISDGTSTIFSGESNGSIAILIALLLPAAQRNQGLFAGTYAASFHVMDERGNTTFILPFIEQESAFHR